MQVYVCNQCGKHTDQPHGCPCGGRGIPTGPLPDDEPTIGTPEEWERLAMADMMADEAQWQQYDLSQQEGQ